jgi:hypothetical protein
MKWIGKHPVFSDLLIGGVLLTPPDSPYEYELTLPNDDGTAGQVLSTDGNGVLSWVANGVAVPNVLTAGTGIDYNTGTTWDGSVAKTISVDVSDFMTNGIDDRVITATGTDAMNAEANMTFDGNKLTLTNTSGSFGSASNGINIVNSDLNTSSAIWANFDKDNAGTNSADYGFKLNYDKTIATTGSNAQSGTGVALNLTDNQTNVGTSTFTGVSNYLSHTTAANTNQAGMVNNLNGATTTYGIKTTATAAGVPATTYGIWHLLADGAYDLMFKSSDVTTDDYFALQTKASGETDITTVDGGAAAAHLNLIIDGQFSVASTGIDISGAGVISNAEWQGTDVGIAYGGTGASTAQAAIDALTAVSGASAGQRLTKDGSGNATWANATTATTLNGTTAGGVATYASANTLDIEPNFTWDGSDLHVSSSVTQKPQLIIENTNTDNKPPSIKLLKDKGAAGADGDYTGTIKWNGDNSAQTETQFGQIRNRIVTALATDEASKMEIDVAASNGTTSQLRNMIEGVGHGTNDTVNVSLGYGAASATTIAGTLTMGSTAAMTNAGLLSVGNQSNITGLGTISSGVWEGTDVGVAHGGTGQSTAQAAIDALSQVSGASAGEALIKDGSGNATWAAQTDTTYSAGDGLDLSGTTFSTDLKSNGGLVIESTELAVDLGATSITGTLAVGDGGTGLTTAGTNYMLTGNGTSALSAESLAQFNGATGRMNVGLALSQFEAGGWYSSGSPSAESPGSGSTIVLKTYNLGGTALPSLFKIAGSGQGGSEPQFRFEGGEANGTDNSGGDIHIIGGAGTGNERSGKFEFHGHPGGGGTGSSNNTTSVKFTIEADGDVSMSGDLTVSGGDITLSGTGRIQGVDTVSASTDAASKGYVDGLIPTVPDEVVSSGTHILKQTKVTINQAGCNALNSSPQTLVAAQGANKIIIPVEVTCLVDRNSADTSLGDLIVGWNSTTTYTYALKYSRRWMYGITTDMTFVLGTYAGKGAASLTGGENVPLTIATSTGMTSNSLTSMTVYTSYYVIDNS